MKAEKFEKYLQGILVEADNPLDTQKKMIQRQNLGFRIKLNVIGITIAIVGNKRQRILNMVVDMSSVSGI